MTTAEEQATLVAALKARLSQPDDQVEQSLITGGETGLDEATLRRWLRANSWIIDKAEGKLRKHAEWRRTFVPNGRIDESEVAAEIATDKVFVQGADVDGRPCMYILAAKHVVAERDVEECKRFVCYALDRCIEQIDPAKNPSGTISIIFDLRGMGMANCDVAITRAVFDTLANHYPERMGVLWMYDAPYIFWGLWTVVSPFIDVVTSKKIIFLYAADPKQMVDSFEPEELPLDVGGTRPMVAVQTAAQSFLQRQGPANGHL